MTEGQATVALGACLAALTAAVGWLIARVLGAREDSIELRAKISALEAEIKEMKGAALTQECVREVVNESLTARDLIAAERRQAWDETLTLKIKAAVVDGVKECQRNTGEELERMVPRIVREMLAARPRARASIQTRSARSQAGK